MDLNGEIRRASGPLRPLIERMAQASEEEREGIWEEHLAALPEEDSNALIGAVAEANPGDPAPDDDGWGAPELEKPVPVEPFPVDIYPETVARLIHQGARSIGCAPDFLGMTVLAVAGAAIGRSVSLLIKEGYFASAVFYVANIGKPGDGKSPAMNAVVRPLWGIDEEEHKRFKEAKADYERDLDAYEEAKKKGRSRPAKAKPKRDKTKEVEELDEDGEDTEDFDSPTETITPIRPILRRCAVDDATTESLALILADNPRGVLVTKDELTALMGSLNQYKSGRGSDRQFFLSAWSGSPIVVDRKGNVGREPIRVPHPYLGIVGGMPPDMFGELAEAKGRDDGFIDRMLFVFPDPLPKAGWSDEGIPRETSEAWAEIVRALWNRPLASVEGKECPNVIKFTPSAKAAWRAWYNSHHAEQNADDFPDWLRGPWAKMEQYAARIALTLHMLQWVVDPFRPETTTSEIESHTMKRVVRLVDYLKSHLRRVHSTMRVGSKGNDGGEYVQTILKWIRRSLQDSFSVRDLTRNFPRLGERPKELQSALSWLEARRCIHRRETEKQAGRPGRKPSPMFDVNPRLLPMLEGRSAEEPPAGSGLDSESVNYVNSAEESATQDQKEDDDDLIPF